MRVARLVLLFLIFVAIPTALLAQQAAQPIQRDPQATLILQRSFVAMGGTTPSDSVATGNVVIVAGSKTDTGTIRILTRGTDQSATQISTQAATYGVVFSRGRANDTEGTSAKSLQLELALTSQCTEFPLALLAGALNDPDYAFEYLGLESSGGLQAHHIRFWNTFASSPKLQPLAGFTVKDVWIDAVNGLPRRLAYDRRAGGGAEPRIPLLVVFSGYRNVGGVYYPFRIEKSLNGTLWTTITIEAVALNTGLTDRDFPTR